MANNQDTSYAARLAQSKEVKEAAAQARAVKQKRHEFVNKVFELETTIERKNDEIDILKGSANLNIDEIMKLQANIDTLNANLSAVKALQSELFPA